ncbi:RNA polymerase sigma factor RpoE [Stieleria maiorica]|uniref:RNA polymerase sigma factor RpoE n=1 Tax=Stieleria maiorica TaxID=2795974 RepID=A0A5B9MH78_9BACT|nr:sigma-70 family RNA polymerase sigma factor [Stieleria maiorica]QEG00254.1 RNA polymerase sigma factor RpoE [Stieleria maiorica]
MTDFPETRESLIRRVKDTGDRCAWEEFSSMYRPVIYRVAKSRGMQDADAQDLAQQVLLAVSSAIGRWEKQCAETKFRHWLSRITRNAVVKFMTRGPRDVAVGGTGMLDWLEECPDPDSETAQRFDLEYRRQLYLTASDQVRRKIQPQSWQIFQMTVLDGGSIEDAARQTDRTIGSVYAVRSRVMRQLREAVSRLEADQS